MDRAEFFYNCFRKHFSQAEPTSCQDNLMHETARFLSSDDGDILVVNGYAGTGKTTVLAALVGALAELHFGTVLLAPTGRAAKVLSNFSHRKAFTIHKHIYRQKSFGADGFGQFSLAPNLARNALFIVDEVSLIGIDDLGRQSSSSFGSGNLLEDLVSFVRSGTGCRLLMVGDSAQLPPVGLDESPALSRSYMEGFGGVSYASLETVVRQGAESGILRNATMLRTLIASSGPDATFDTLKFDLSGCEDVERVSGGELIEKLSDAYGRWGDEDVTILCRSNKRAIRYNLGVRSTVQYKEDRLVRGDRLMIVKNCYQFLEENSPMGYIANGDVARLEKIGRYTERYGLHFADATLSFPDYDSLEVEAKVCLDTLESEAASLSYDQQNALYQGVSADYPHITSKKKRYEAVREDPYYNALQLKYANAITCHKSQGGQWNCVFIDCPFWADEQTLDDLKWLYTAVTRAVQKVYLVNFPDKFFR